VELWLINETTMWELKEGKLQKTFSFVDFDACIDFILQLQKIANSLDHHPDIQIHGYRYVTLSLFTHDLALVTDRDYAFAQKVDQLF
jgi:4a-hydroxytetrahydrobiopterin dehydratase